MRTFSFAGHVQMWRIQRRQLALEPRHRRMDEVNERIKNDMVRNDQSEPTRYRISPGVASEFRSTMRLFIWLSQWERMGNQCGSPSGGRPLVC